MEKLKLILNAVVFCFIIGAILIIFLVTPEKKESLSERRPLKTFEEVMNGENHPFDEFEGYFLDQFPFREGFRRIKTYYNNNMDILGKDNNGIYKLDGSYIKMEENLDESQVEYAADLINKVIEKEGINENNVYYSIIPDKHYYGSKLGGYPALDYDKMFSIMSKKLEKAEYIDITGKLSISDYYKTDPHWSQDKITDVAEHLVSSMNDGVSIKPKEGWKINVLEPYYGLYHGQLLIDMPADKIVYLTSDATENMKVTMPEKPAIKDVYTIDLFKGKDPYDVFLAGAMSYIEIENPNAQSDRTLVVFRDSFGSSIAPLMAHGYKKTVLIDLRYMMPDMIRNFVKFDENTDVLFLYSTGLLNGGRILRNYNNIRTK